MRSEWNEVKLGDVAQIRRGSSPRPIINFMANSGMPWVKIADATENDSRFINSTKEFIRKEGVPKSVIVKKGDLILSNSGTAGLPKFMGITACVHDGWQVFKELDGIDKNFLYYLLINIRAKLLFNAYDSTMKNLTLDMVREAKINLPPLPTQKKIAHILSTLDDKIELNRKMNQTLEEMAQALFKSWFVDFDPVHLKARCKSDAELERGARELGISKEILELFPSGFEESELGMIPEGWGVSTIGNKLNVLLGGTPSRRNDSYWTNGTVSWINSGKVNEFRITEPSEMITEEAVKKSSTKLLPKKTTVLAITGATLGQVSLLEIDSCANQSVIGLPETEELSHSFIYPCICNAISELMSHQTGGAQQHINKRNVEDYIIVVPSLGLLSEYVLLAKPIMEKISINSFEIQSLQQTRDALLPKLLSGELDVSEIEV